MATGFETLAQLVNMSTQLQANKRANERLEREQFLQEGVPQMVAQEIAGGIPGQQAFDPTNPQDLGMIFAEAGTQETIPALVNQYLAAGAPDRALPFMRLAEQTQNQNKGAISALSSKDRSFLLSKFPTAATDEAAARDALQWRSDNWDDYQNDLQEYSNVLTEGKFRSKGINPETGGLIIEDSKTGQQLESPDAVEVITQNRGDLSDGQIQTITKMGTVDKLLKDLSTNYNRDFIGIIDFNARRVGQNFVDMPAFTKMRRQIMETVELAYEISGKQLSDRERAYITQAFLPNPQWSEANYLQSLQDLGRYVRIRGSSFVEGLKAGRKHLGGYEAWMQLDGTREVDDDAILSAENQMGTFADFAAQYDTTPNPETGMSEAEEMYRQAIETYLMINDYKID